MNNTPVGFTWTNTPRLVHGLSFSLTSMHKRRRRLPAVLLLHGSDFSVAEKPRNTSRNATFRVGAVARWRPAAVRLAPVVGRGRPMMQVVQVVQDAFRFRAEVQLLVVEPVNDEASRRRLPADGGAAAAAAAHCRKQRDVCGERGRERERRTAAEIRGETARRFRV